MTKSIRSWLVATSTFVVLSCGGDSPLAPTVGEIQLSFGPSSGASIVIDAARVTLTGPTSKVVTLTSVATTGIVLDSLVPGSYSAAVEGLQGGAVAFHGQATGIVVAAGDIAQAHVTVASFVPQALVAPDSVDVLRFDVSYGAVTGATGYIVSWSTSPTMSGASTKSVTGTSTDIQVAGEDDYWVTVRAVNSLVPNGGKESAAATVFAFQGVATVTVTPASPAIAPGGTQQFAAEARDADNAVVTNTAFFWASSNHTVATVSQTGLVTGVGGGTATITAVGKGMPGSATITVIAPVATKLAFIQQPAATTAGAAISPAIQVEVQDASSNRVASSSAAVTIAINTGTAGATLSGTKTVNAINGVASFTGLSLDKSGASYTLGATSGTLTQAISAAFTVTAGPATKLSFTQQPSNSNTDQNITAEVSVQDAFGNLVATSANVTMTLGANPGSGTLSGTTTVGTTNGVVSFTLLRLNKVAAGYTLTANAGLLTAATSTGFDVAPGAPARLTFSTQPAAAEPAGTMDPLAVSVIDAAGNVTTAAVSVSLAIATNAGGGALSGTTSVTSAAGVASFNNVAIDSSGNGYRLRASASGLPDTTSVAFDVVIDFARMHAGDRTTCGTTARGGGYCWGYNGVVGDIGDGTTTDRLAPVRISGGHRWLMVVPGFSHTCGIRANDSTAYCWGNNGNGQLGTGGTGTLNPTPLAVSGGHKFFLISPGEAHTCALRSTDSTAFCWGLQTSGRLGNGQTAAANVLAPTAVSGGTKFKQISAGSAHTCALRVSDARGMCWGLQDNGRLGNGTTAAGTVSAPVQVVASPLFEISAGQAHSCGIMSDANDRRAVCWGANADGQLGTGNQSESGSAELVANGYRYIGIRAGFMHTCGVTVAGDAFCWGRQDGGRLGNNTSAGAVITSPVPVFGSLKFVWVGAAAPGPGPIPRGCGLTATGGAYCWGLQPVGDGTFLPSYIPMKVKGTK